MDQCVCFAGPLQAKNGEQGLGGWFGSDQATQECQISRVKLWWGVLGPEYSAIRDLVFC